MASTNQHRDTIIKPSEDSESDTDSIDTEIQETFTDVSNSNSSLVKPATVSKLKPKRNGFQPSQSLSTSIDQSINQSINKSIDQSANPSEDETATLAKQAYIQAQQAVIDAENKPAQVEEPNLENREIDINVGHQSDDEFIPESPIISPMTNPVNRSVSSVQPINMNSSNNQSIDQSQQATNKSKSNNIQSDQNNNLKPRTRTIPSAWAAERGCEPATTSTSFILSISAASSEGQRFVDCPAVFAHHDPTTMLLNLSDYLASMIPLPWIPLTIAQTEDCITALDCLTETYGADPTNQSINQWIHSAKEHFLEPINLNLNVPCVSPPIEPVNTVNNLDKVTIPKATSWSNVLTSDSAALINRSRNTSSPATQLKLKLCFKNNLVCNLIIAQLKQWHSLKSNQNLASNYQSIASQQLTSPRNDGFKVVLPAYMKSKQSNARAAMFHLNQPILKAFDETDHGLNHITHRPSLLFHLVLKMELFETRFIVCRVEGLAVNSTFHPYAATQQSINQPSNISDHEALESLKKFICYHPALQTGATSVTIPVRARKSKRGVCYLTTPRQNLSIVSKIVSHWKANPPTEEKDAWKMNVSIDLSKEALSFCDYCQQPGHRQATCPMLAMGSPALVNSSNVPVPLCKRCQTPDIPSHACVLLSSVTCSLCGELGHPSRDCHLAQRSWAKVAGSNSKNQSSKPAANNLRKVPPKQRAHPNQPHLNQSSNANEVSAPVMPQPDISTLSEMKKEIVALQQQMISQMHEQMKQTMLLVQSAIRETVHSVISAILPASLPNHQPAPVTQVQAPQTPALLPSEPRQINQLFNQPIGQHSAAASSSSPSSAPPLVTHTISPLADAVARSSISDIICTLSRSQSNDNIDNIIQQLQLIKSQNVHG